VGLADGGHLEQQRLIGGKTEQSADEQQKRQGDSGHSFSSGGCFMVTPRRETCDVP
jgi:hypothetical protein